jgi:hypothetical protein
MAQQISVNSATGNIQIQISRGAIGPSTTANVANTALNLNAASTSNVIIGGGTNGYVLATDGAGNTSWVAQTGGGATNPAGSNTQVQFNDAGAFGAESTFTYDKTTDVLTVDHFSGEGGNISNIAGANVSGAVALATSATSANAVAYANVSGTPTLGNISTINIDGNVANVLRGDGSFAADANSSYGDSNVVTLLNAFGSNTINTTGLITGDGGGLSNITGANVSGEVSFAATANAVAGANVSGSVANATLADFATTANAVAGANVSGEVSFAATANAVAGANVSGSVANATLADFATTANAVAGANVSGVVANATHSTISDSANSVAVANVSGIGNIATLNLDGNVANVLSGDGTFIAAGGTYGDSNVVTLMGAFGSNTINTTGNVDTGNLDINGNLFIGNATANVEIAPQGDFAFNSGVVQTLEQYTADYSGGPGAYAFNNEKAYVVNGYGTNTGVDTEATLLSQSYYANDGTNTAKGYTQTVYSADPVGTDPLFPGSFEQKAPTYLTDLANVNTQTQTTLAINSEATPGIFFSAQTAIPADSLGNASAVWSQMNYSDTAMRFSRRNGNADARTQVVANDQMGRIEWAPQSMTGGGGGPQLRSRPSFLTGKVSSAFGGANGERVGQGIEFGVVNDTGLTVLTHDFHPNGSVTFNAAGVINGDGGGLSNIASANVTGLGNIATLNLDGNVANVLSGDGTFIAAGGGTYGDSNVVTLMGAFGSNTISTTGLITGDGGGLSNVSSVATPGGFFDSVQFNNSGVLGGDSTLTYSTSSKQLSLNGAAGGAGGVPTFNINNGGFNVFQEEIGGGQATFSFNNYYAGGLIAPSTYFRARGTASAPTGVASGDQVVSEGYYVRSGPGAGHTYVGVGGQTAIVQSNDGLGNVAVTYTISTAKPASGPNAGDKIFLDTEFVELAGNIMTLHANKATAKATFPRLAQTPFTVASLPTASVNIGERAMITDGPASWTGGTLAATSGVNQAAPVYYDGSNWRFG